jgi:hypothetical protein
MSSHRAAPERTKNIVKQQLTLEDFPDKIAVTIENGWIVVWLKTCRVKFRNWATPAAPLNANKK